VAAFEKGGEEPFFTEHAAENETEFYADATEAFYCKPHDLRADFPAVYEVLAAYYKVDPARWFPEPP
jgi:Mlc titration factor MtfA (ptsG expression regulator)